MLEIMLEEVFKKFIKSYIVEGPKASYEITKQEKNAFTGFFTDKLRLNYNLYDSQGEIVDLDKCATYKGTSIIVCSDISFTYYPVRENKYIVFPSCGGSSSVILPIDVVNIITDYYNRDKSVLFKMGFDEHVSERGSIRLRYTTEAGEIIVYINRDNKSPFGIIDLYSSNNLNSFNGRKETEDKYGVPYFIKDGDNNLDELKDKIFKSLVEISKDYTKAVSNQAQEVVEKFLDYLEYCLTHNVYRD